jgi:DNA-binding MarR family transcriptional regulator
MTNEMPNPPAGAPVPDPATLLHAIGSPVRWHALRSLALAGPQSVNDLAAQGGRAQDAMSRHLTELWQVGAVVVVDPPDGDRRKIFYAIPPERLREAAGGKEIDYGACVLRFS